MGLLKNFFVTDTSSQNLSLLAFSQSPIATLLTDSKGEILSINHAFTELTGYTSLEVKECNMSLLKSGEYNHAFYKSFYKKLMNTNRYNLEIYNRCKNGEVVLMKERIVSVKDNGTAYYIITLEDITEQKKQSDRYQHLALHDMLTGLPNRTVLKDRFSQALLNATRGAKKLAVLMCDLNEFKDINDTYGHNVGDYTLKAAAKKLKENLRASDTIARYGGDEFVIILEQIENITEIHNVIETLNAIFPLSIKINESIFDISMSIGYSFFPDEGTSFEQLLELADKKMYVEKNHYYGL